MTRFLKRLKISARALIRSLKIRSAAVKDHRVSVTTRGCVERAQVDRLVSFHFDLRRTNCPRVNDRHEALELDAMSKYFGVYVIARRNNGGGIEGVLQDGASGIAKPKPASKSGKK
jgi:hypothetical protein